MVLLAVSSLLLVLCAPLLWNTGSLFVRTWAVADVLFFGSCVLLALERLLEPRPVLIIDNLGIADNASAVGAGFIAWEEIAGASLRDLGASRFLVTSLRDPRAVLARQSPIRRGVMAANSGIVGSPVTIPGNTTTPLEEIREHVRARLAGRSVS